MAETKKKLRQIAAPFVALGPSGVAIRDRLKHLSAHDEKVLRAVGEHQGRLASRDLKARCADGHDHSTDTWAARKRELTKESSSRIAGAITKSTHDQWALSRRCQVAHIHNLEAGIRMLRDRLSLPVGEKGTKRAPGGYRSRQEWFAKSRRLTCLEDRLEAARVDWESGRVRVVRGGSGDWPPMRPLPGEQRLADEFGVARMTARKAVRVLADEGTVFVVPQRGAFVSAPEQPGSPGA